MSSEYVAYRETGPVGRPLINVQFVLPNGIEGHVAMLVDTGADNIVLPGEYMELWGVQVGDCEKLVANTVVGTTESFKLGGVKVSFPDYWMDREFEADIFFSQYLDDRPFEYGLLGREPTLDYVSCTFGHSEGYGFRIHLGR